MAKNFGENGRLTRHDVHAGDRENSLLDAKKPFYLTCKKNVAVTRRYNLEIP